MALPGVESSQAQVKRLLPVTFWMMLFFTVKLLVAGGGEEGSGWLNLIPILAYSLKPFVCLCYKYSFLEYCALCRKKAELPNCVDKFSMR